MVGEIAMLTSEARSATVRAIRDSELVKFSNRACYHVADKYPRVLLQIAQVIAKRLEAMNRAPQVAASLTNVAVVPIDLERAHSEFATRLVSALAGLGPTLHLSSRRFDDMWGEVGAAQTPSDNPATVKIENWLNDQESKYQFVLYEADSAASHWTRRCLRQADRILLVGWADSSPRVGPLESDLLNPEEQQTAARVELAVVHPSEITKASDTVKWLEPRRVSRHYHVRWDSPDDFARLARLVTERAVALVLGGGGVRGFAHIGALRAIQEAGVPIDFIGGTSMGALMAAQYALGWDYETRVRTNRRMFREAWPMNDYTIPIMACLAGQKFDNTLRAMFGDSRIEDLLLNYFCVSTNLTTAGLVVHQDGLLWRRVRASCSLPGIMPPEFDNGHMLVDGAVLNNVPGDVMKRLCGGRVMAVDVSPRQDNEFQVRYDERPVTRRILWGQVNPFTEGVKVPNIFDIVSRSAMISSIANSSVLKAQLDLYLHLPLDQFGMSESKSFDKIIAVGYESTRRQIEALKENRTFSRELLPHQAQAW